MSYTYEYPRPAVATDCVVFGFDGRELQILLIERGNEPYKGYWAFPGGFMNMDESAEQCALRELQEETGLTINMLKQLGAFTDVHRDPRGRVVSIAFYALVRPTEVKGGDDASEARWFAIDEVPRLAFDHDYILRKAMQQLRKDIHFEPIGFELLNKSFTMSELQRLYDGRDQSPRDGPDPPLVVYRHPQVGFMSTCRFRSWFRASHPVRYRHAEYSRRDSFPTYSKISRILR